MLFRLRPRYGRVPVSQQEVEQEVERTISEVKSSLF